MTEVAIALELLETVINDPRQQDYEVAVADIGEHVAGYVLFGPVPLTEGQLRSVLDCRRSQTARGAASAGA